MIQNYDSFSKWNVKCGKFCTLWNFHIFSTMINIKKLYIEEMHIWYQVVKYLIQVYIHMRKNKKD